MQKARQVLEGVQRFVEERIIPAEAEIAAWLRSAKDPWQRVPKVEALKAEAKKVGLWNLFLADPARGAGLGVRAYAPVAEAMGRSIFAPEIFNCNAPDTGNMEILHAHGTEAQKTDG